MSALIERTQIQKVRVTDENGVEHEFEGKGHIRLSGFGKTVTEVEATLRIED